VSVMMKYLYWKSTMITFWLKMSSFGSHLSLCFFRHEDLFWSEKNNVLLKLWFEFFDSALKCLHLFLPILLLSIVLQVHFCLFMKFICFELDIKLFYKAKQKQMCNIGTQLPCTRLLLLWVKGSNWLIIWYCVIRVASPDVQMLHE